MKGKIKKFQSKIAITIIILISFIFAYSVINSFSEDHLKRYIPHYTVDIILAIISAIIFLYMFIREETNILNNSLSFFMFFLLNLATMVLLHRNFTSSVKYLDATGFGGNVIYGSLAIVAFILCIISLIKSIFIIYNKYN
ncbi:hypothetical protein KQI41_05110 [Tissierella pigra]|uniref:Uncharacterized protein n=1 Tax=Tissierella pigra TaxID=2607614 RepID=A0A6N7XY22_9FIRM|nr:hypothetical protein [Tissierella pigra]MBU5425788.1 hypothetical protein [Tissierella pigra]MSU01474.1 hypothetical protein [Tissierella pigra]